MRHLTYDRIETSAKVPANNRIYLAREERSNHERLRVQARIGAILAAPKPAGVEALRVELEAAGINALVCRDEGPMTARDGPPEMPRGKIWGYIDEVDRHSIAEEWVMAQIGALRGHQGGAL